MIDLAVEYYKDKNDADKKGAAFYVKGCILEEYSKDIPNALLAYKEAEMCIPDMNEKRYVARIYSSLGYINKKSFHFDPAKEYYQKAVQANIDGKDTAAQTSNLLNLLQLYHIFHDTDSVNQCITKLLQFSSSLKDSILQSKIYHNIAVSKMYQEKYEEAEDMLEQVMGLNGHASQGYDLLDDFGDVWSISHNNSVESLFEVQTNSDIAYNLGLRMPVVCGSRDDGGWAWGLPTSNLETAFKTAGDDIRLKWTIIKDKATSVPGDTHWSSTVPYSVSTDSHKSGRVTRKVYIPYAQRPEPYDASHNPLNYRILRYADVLLMYAEVENVLKDDGQARWALNKVRERVDLDPVESSGTELRDAIRQERRLELALENQRLFDIRRWKNDSGKSVMSDIMGPNGSFVIYNTKESTDTYELGNQKESSSKGRNFKEERDLVYPIPTTEISQSNGSIVQNPGYN